MGTIGYGPVQLKGNTCEEKKCLKMFTPGQKNIRKLRCVDVIDPVYGSHESLMQQIYFNIDVKKIDLKTLIYIKLKQKYNFVWRSAQYVAM